jgi:hypothetical protein
MVNTFALVLAIVSHDPSRPTRSYVIADDMSLEQCIARGSAEFWSDRVKNTTREYSCQSQFRRG